MATAHAAPVTPAVLGGLVEMMRPHLADFFAVPVRADVRTAWRGYTVGAALRGEPLTFSRVDVAELNSPERMAGTPDPITRALVALLNAYGTHAREWASWNLGRPSWPAHPGRGVSVERWPVPAAFTTEGPRVQGPHDLPALREAAETLLMGGPGREAAARVLVGALRSSEETAGPWLVGAALAGIDMQVDAMRPGYSHPLAAAAGVLPVLDAERVDAAVAVVARDLAPLIPTLDRGPLYGLLAWLGWIVGRREQATKWGEVARAGELPMGLLGDVAAAAPVVPWRVTER